MYMCILYFPKHIMYGYRSWTIKKAEHRRTDAFELWCSRRLLRVPWTTRRSNQSILKEVSPEYSLEGLMLKLKRQHFGHLMQRTDSLEKTLEKGSRPSCHNQERRRGSDEVVPGTSVFPLSESGMSRNFWGRIKGAKYRFALQDGTWDFS